MSGTTDNNVTTRRRPQPLDVRRLRADFPILQQRVHGKPLVYLDTTASAQKPRSVVDALDRFYLTQSSNVHRGLHELSMQATEAYEGSRSKVQRFIGAADSREIVYTRGTTESINLVARSLGDQRSRHGDEILISEMEHHSNIVPWQQYCERTGARLRVAPIDDAGELRLDESAVFYLRSRGLSDIEARNLLIGAFAGEVLEQIDVEILRSHLERTVTDRLRQAAG